MAARLGARRVAATGRFGSALNSASRRAAGNYLLLVPAGFELHESLLDRCESIFGGCPSVAAIAPVVALRTPDGCGELHWMPGPLTVAGMFSNTRSTPPVFAVRRGVFESIGGFDETLEGLIEYEFWLRMLLAGREAVVLAEPLLFREVAGPRSGDPEGDRRHVGQFQAVMERHAATIDHDMTEVLIAREIRFGELREAHRALLARRDIDLSTLDELRAEAAHHRAYVSHHARADVDWGDLRRVNPVSREWGYDRGQPVDRRYIEDFLASHSSDVRGAVLEVQEDDFSRSCGGPRVTEYSILDIDAANPGATVIADLRSAPEIPSARFDCIIVTQTLHVIDDMAAAVRECHRMLKPEGVLLATIPAASRVCLDVQARQGISGGQRRRARGRCSAPRSSPARRPPPRSGTSSPTRPFCTDSPRRR